MNAEDQDWRIGRIYLLVVWRRRKGLRQLPAGGVDRRLDIAGGGIDVATEVELHGDRADAEHARRRHLGDAGNFRELTLEWGRHRRRHRDRIGAGKLGRDLDGGEIDLWQGGDRQE